MARSARRRRKQKADAAGIVLILAVLVLVGAGGWFYLGARSAAELDEKNCVRGQPAAVHAVVIDRTDQISDVQRASVRRDLENWILELPPNELVEIYAVVPKQGAGVEPHFSGCTVPKASGTDPLYGNPRLAEKRWNEKFHGPIQATLDELLSPEPKEESPIMETVQMIGIDLFRRPQARNASGHLLLISDMLENSKDYSQYKGSIDFGSYRGTPHYLRTRPRLPNVDVEIWYLRRSNATQHQGRKHIDFWEAWFSDVGAVLSRVLPVEG